MLLMSTSHVSGQTTGFQSSEPGAVHFCENSVVMHPLYGIGFVESILDKEILGKTNKFAAICFQDDKLKIMLNLEQKNSLIRPLIDASEISSVLSYMKTFKTEIPVRSAERYNINMKKIKSSDIYQLAEVIKDLVLLGKDKKLTPKEFAMLKQSKKMLASELAYVASISCEDAELMIDENSRC